MENSTFPSLRSISSISTSNPALDPHSLLLWNQTRQQWCGNKTPQKRASVREPKLSADTSYETLLGTNKLFPQPIPLPILNIVNTFLDIISHYGSALTNLALGGLEEVKEKGFWVQGSDLSQITGRTRKRENRNENQEETIEVDNPSEGLKVRSKLLRKTSLSDDFWSPRTSACEMEGSNSEFVNHGLIDLNTVGDPFNSASKLEYSL
ncbi:hypothetical protein KY285_027387 [Solanum tuberosum]|nr:hypothetical protein KY289_027589 [Solanum tuberosum]KAH0666181.1 hypothetical protein KY285_027387 [Solanum tuberosum]